MAKLTYTCPICHKVTFETKRTKLETLEVIAYNCGHSQIVKLSSKAALQAFKDGRKLYPFQAKSVDFISEANGRALIAHEMGLGKTLCAIGWLSSTPQALPALIICKSNLRMQWLRELVAVCGIDLLPQLFTSPKEFVLPMAKVYIVSIDMLASFPVAAFSHCKTVVLDETQTIKNHEAKRTQAARAHAQGKPYFVGLSGTPIKNNAGEYFPILNMIRPSVFHNQNDFIKQYCFYDESAYGLKARGLVSPSQFKEATQDFILRYERSEVAPELPSIQRNNEFIDMSDSAKEAYSDLFDEFTDYYDEHGESNSSEVQQNILAYFAKMRHITGLAKVASCVDFVESFLDSTERKIVVFAHHKDVCSNIAAQLRANNPKIRVLELRSDLDYLQRDRVVQDFKNYPHCRVLVASTLASGEGLNLQFCADAVMLERQWNPANEEQAEARFTRIGSVSNAVMVTYMTAVGTIDEYFGELVEQKRQIMNEALRGEAQESWDQSSLMRELAGVLASKGKNKWAKPKR